MSNANESDVRNGNKRKVGAYITNAQKNQLRILLSENQQLRCGKFSASFTAKDAAKAWEDIANQLNAIPGAKKDWKAWRKTWQDIYSKVKAKQADVNRGRRQTGGGPPPAPLNDYEESVAALINPRVVSGHKDSEESRVEFDFAEPLAGSASVDDDEVVVWQIADDSQTQSPERTSTQHTQQRKTKINIKTVLKEKVGIKKKYYEEKIIIMKENNEVLRSINNSLQLLANSFAGSTLDRDLH